MLLVDVKYPTPENQIIQLSPSREKIQNPSEIIAWEELNKMRNGTKIITLTSFDIIEIVKYGCEILRVYEDFFDERLSFNPYTEFLIDMCEKGDKHKAKGKDLLQTLDEN